MAPSEFQCEVTSFRNITPTVFEIGFSTDKPLDFKGGQFISAVIPGAGPGGRDLRRAYSIASPPGRDTVQLCIKLVEGGPGTTFLNHLRPGAKFKVYAPYGDFVYKPKPGRHICFVATGTGLSPFRSILLSAGYRDNPAASATLLLGVRNVNEVLYPEELGNLPYARWVPCVSQPETAWSGFKGRVTDYLRAHEHEINWAETEFYLCGAGAMIDEVKQMLASKGVQKDAIHQEVYYKAKTV